LPLSFSVSGQPWRNGIAVHQKTVEHQSEVCISDAPFSKKAFGAGGQHRVRSSKQLVGSMYSSRRQGGLFAAKEDHLGRSLLTDPDGHFKFLHLWPLKLPQAGWSNYASVTVSAMREVASLRR
jgi:hypothetical protein